MLRSDTSTSNSERERDDERAKGTMQLRRSRISMLSTSVSAGRKASNATDPREGDGIHTLDSQSSPEVSESMLNQSGDKGLTVMGLYTVSSLFM